MVTFSLLILFLIILFGIYKILKGIISFFFGSNSNSNGDKITFYDIMDDDGPSDLKYRLIGQKVCVKTLITLDIY